MSAAPSSSDEKATIVSPGPKKGFFSKKDKVQEKGADEKTPSEKSVDAKEDAKPVEDVPPVSFASMFR